MPELFTDAKSLLARQYASPDNLMARVALYDRFGGDGPSLQDVRLDHAGLTPEETVIDFGAGNGLIWRRAQERGELPKDLTLLDLSQGMLDAAKEGLDGADVRLVCHNLSNPLYLGRQYDVAFALHMLYHLSDPYAAMDKILEQIKPGGRAVVHLNAVDHLGEMRQLINAFEEEKVIDDQFIAGKPSPEDARDYWQGRFQSCDWIETGGTLKVTEAGPLIDYIMSIETLHGQRYDDADRRAAICAFVDEEIKEAMETEGAFHIHGHSILLKFGGKL